MESQNLCASGSLFEITLISFPNSAILTQSNNQSPTKLKLFITIVSITGKEKKISKQMFKKIAIEVDTRFQ